MDTNITIPKKEIAPGIFSTGGTATMPTVNPISGQTNVITPQSLAPQPTIQGLPTTPVPTTPTTQPPQTTPAVSPFAGYLKGEELNQQEQQAQELKSTGMEQYFKDLIGSQGEAQYRADEFAKTDYTKNRQQLLNAENEWIRLEAEKNQDDITTARKLQNEERRDTLLPFAQMGQAKIQGDAAMYRALKTSEQGMLTARQMALQNNLELANEEVERAVAVKYAPFKERIATWEKVSAAIQPYLDSAEKKQLAKQNLKKDLAMKEIEKAEEDEKSIQSLALKAISTGNAPSNILNQVQGKSVMEAMETLAPYLKTQNTDVVQLDNGNTLLIDKNSGKIIKNFGGAKPTTSTTNIANPLIVATFGTLINTTSNLEDTVAGKTAIKEQLASMLNVGDYDGAYNQIANSVAKGLTGETKNRFENARIDYEVLKGFKGALQQYIDAGGNTGLLKGTAEQITRKLGAVTDPALTSLAVQLQREFQTYRNTMTGAAFTPKESSEYASVNPTASKSLNLNLAVVDGALNQLQNRVDGTIRAKVPQAADIQKIRQAPQTAEKAKQQVNTIYTKVDADVKSAIEGMINKGVSDEDILDYLQLKGLK